MPKHLVALQTLLWLHHQADVSTCRSAGRVWRSTHPAPSCSFARRTLPCGTGERRPAVHGTAFYAGVCCNRCSRMGLKLHSTEMATATTERKCSNRSGGGSYGGSYCTTATRATLC